MSEATQWAASLFILSNNCIVVVLSIINIVDVEVLVKFQFQTV